MRHMQGFAILSVLLAAGRLSAQDRPDILGSPALETFERGEPHPLAPNHRLETITLGGSLPARSGQPRFRVATRVVVADSETRWPDTVVTAGERAVFDRTVGRQFTVAAGSPKATTRLETAPTIVELEEGSRLVIRVLDNGDDLITVDVTFEELTVRESGETAVVREKQVAAPQQTSRRVRSFRTAKLGSEIGIPLDGKSTRDSKQMLLVKVTRK